MKRAAAVLAAALLAAACADDPTPSKPAEPISIGAPAGAPTAPRADGSLPPGHPPIDAGRDAPVVPAAPAAGRGIAADRFRAPEGWQPEKSASAMRLLQFRLPRADGDAKDGEVAVFGSDMGSPAANIERWRGQFAEVAQGKDRSEEIPAGEKGTVHLLDITGKFSGGMGPAGAPAGEVAGETRMIAAVAELPAGRFYVKVTGPPATMGKWEKSIREFILEAAAR
jgi:hypothetical protein